MPPVEQFKHAVQRGDVAEFKRLLASDASLRTAINEPVFAFDSPVGAE